MGNSERYNNIDTDEIKAIFAAFAKGVSAGKQQDADNKAHATALYDSFDHEHLWHPYTSAIKPLPAFKVKSAHDRTLVLDDGTELIDAMSSWWCAVHGYQVPEITKALQDQAATLSHVMFAGLTHEPAIELGKKLLKLVPDMDYVFYGDSGSVAVEIAMKMAMQAQEGHNRFYTVLGGYHGDTLHAMSVSDPCGMHRAYTKAIPEQVFVSAPKTPYPGAILGEEPLTKDEIEESIDADPEDVLCEEDLDALQELEDESNAGYYNSAAIIVEPMVQGAGGMNFYHPAYLKKLREICEESGTLLIFDEIATGFGRTGKLFAYEHAGIVPDIMLLGKALTGGYMTLSAVLATKEVAEQVSDYSKYDKKATNGTQAFMHGPTFMANPLACATASASLDYLQSYDAPQKARDIEKRFKEGLLPATKFASVKQVRVLGAIAVIELKQKPNVAQVMQWCLQYGVWLRPMGKLLYAMPPLTMTAQEQERVINAMLNIAQRC